MVASNSLDILTRSKFQKEIKRGTFRMQRGTIILPRQTPKQIKSSNKFQRLSHYTLNKKKNNTLGHRDNFKIKTKESKTP